jgi:hypothetical protein
VQLSKKEVKKEKKEKMTNEVNPRIIDLLQQEKKKEGDKPLVSLEFFPPRTQEGVKVRKRREEWYGLSVHTC